MVKMDPNARLIGLFDELGQNDDALPFDAAFDLLMRRYGDRLTPEMAEGLRGAVQALTRRRAEENLARQVRDQAQPTLPSRGGSQHASRVRGKR